MLTLGNRNKLISQSAIFYYYCKFNQISVSFKKVRVNRANLILSVKKAIMLQAQLNLKFKGSLW